MTENRLTATLSLEALVILKLMPYKSCLHETQICADFGNGKQDCDKALAELLRANMIELNDNVAVGRAWQLTFTGYRALDEMKGV